jgi:type IV pilus assembly protein PilB
MADPSDIVAIDEVRFITGHNIQPMVAPDISIQNTLNRYYDTAGVARSLVRDFQQKELEGAEPDQGKLIWQSCIEPPRRPRW